MMQRSRFLLASTLILLFATAEFALAGVSIGVKKGDWIEYQVSTTGVPEEGHDVTWARMDILTVQGTEISVNVTTRAKNGTYSNMTMSLDPSKGRVGVWFIIPAGLSAGDSFFDASTNHSVTIEGADQKMIAGATRNVTHSSTPQRIKSWDEASGVFVESVDTLPSYTLHAIADKTNLWSAQSNDDWSAFYVVALSFVVIAVVVAVLFAKRIRKRNLPQKS